MRISILPMSLTIPVLGIITSNSCMSQSGYVDLLIDSSQCQNYNPNVRTCSNGTELAFKDLTGAANQASAGDTISIRAGEYSETLRPQNSGVNGNPIIFENYNDETVTISGGELAPGIELSDRDYIVIRGLVISDVRRWLYALNAHHNVISNNIFRRANDPWGSSKTGMFFQEATFNVIKDNLIESSTQDNLALIKSDRNLVVNNRFINAYHTLWVIKCGNHNVIRGNYFYNEQQKIGEIYDCDGVGFNHEFTIKNATKYNLVEGNEFALVPSSGDHSPYSGIQYAGQSGIVRRNRFYDTVGPGLSMASYSGEAEYNTDNRIYHNVFFKSDFAGVQLSQSGSSAFQGNIFKNNILAKSIFVANDTRWTWYTDVLEGKSVQITTEEVSGFVFDTNIIYSKGAGETYLVAYGSRFSDNNPVGQSMDWWESNHPNLFRQTLEVDPLFQNEATRSFQLKSSSLAIDAGTFLSTTMAAGSGTSMQVADVTYFYDGFEIPGEVGDVIQLQNQTETATVIDINYQTNTLTLDRSLTWSENQGVALKYSGIRPDIGAYEHAPNTPPSPPLLFGSVNANPLTRHF